MGSSVSSSNGRSNILTSQHPPAPACWGRNWRQSPAAHVGPGGGTRSFEVHSPSKVHSPSSLAWPLLCRLHANCIHLTP